MASLIIKNLTKRYGNKAAVKNLNLEVKNKEFLVMVGPSGCGKTTTLHSIAGLIRIDEGEILLGDKVIDSPGKGIFTIPQKRGMAMVFQDYAIYPHMTVFGNIAFPLEIRKFSKNEIETRVKKTAKLLKIEELLDRKPNALSGGQRQRIALGRAIVRNADIFLLDEPLANLDAKLRVHSRGELKKLQRRLGVTAIFVTHDQVEAMTIGDRVVIMNDGHLEQIGTPAEVYHNPRNRFVAEFIGSPPMNMIEGVLEDIKGSLAINLNFFSCRLFEKTRKLIKSASIREVILGIRPENILITKEKKEDSFKATVNNIELTGKEFNVYLEAGGFPLIAISSHIQDLDIKRNVWLSLDKEKIKIFDKKTGEALY